MNKLINTLFEAYLKGNSTEADTLSLLAYFKIPSEEALLKNCILLELEKEVRSEIDVPDLTDRLEANHNRIKSHIQSTHLPEAKKKLKINWGYISAIAASIVILIGIVTYYQLNPSVSNPVEKAAKLQPIRPGANKAILILANGKKINLSEGTNNKLGEESGIEITKTNDGQLVYHVTTTNIPKANQLFNVVETPKGGQYQIHLPDGTKVWLNAGSSLRYPLSFAGLKTRKVELKGEAYFEVAKNKMQPFRVVSTVQEIEVLGTHFNVSAYADDCFTKTTLLEGKVSIGKLDANQKWVAEKTLNPGQQSLITKNKFELRTGIDTKAEIAWKNGQFVFVNEPIEEIMQKIARWYNIEVIYDGDMKNKAFAGTISRFDDISKLLNMIESTNTVHFKIKGRSVIVMD